MHKNTNLVNAKLAEHGVSPRRESNCTQGQPGVLCANVLCYVPSNPRSRGSSSWRRRRKLRRRSDEIYALSSFVGVSNGFAKGQTRLEASEESDANMRGKIADFGSVSIVKRTLKMIEG